MINLRGFGSRLQAIRMERSMTQQELAERAELSTHYIGNLEQGVRKPSSTVIFKLCCALGTTPDTLFADSLTENMRRGLSSKVSDTNTLREAIDILGTALSDLLDLDQEEPELFGVPLSQIPQEPHSSAEETLSSLLLSEMAYPFYQKEF